MCISETDIRRRLSRLDTSKVDNPYPRGTLNEPLQSAAVLIPLLNIDSDWHILLIRRATNTADYHSGQMALPGGRSQAGDRDAQATALREANEEIGLRPDDVTILGHMNRFTTISDHIIEPVVGIIPWPYTVTLQESEVSEAITIPIRWIADTDNYEIREYKSDENAPLVPVIYFREYKGRIVWGVTARIILTLAGLLA